MNTDELEYAMYGAERRVLEIQAKLHRWAGDDPHRRFDDLFNLVADPAFLLVAWFRVRGNKGARTAGVDGETAHYIEAVRGVDGFLEDDLGSFAAHPEHAMAVLLAQVGDVGAGGFEDAQAEQPEHRDEGEVGWAG